jgi:hypothetical protein
MEDAHKNARKWRVAASSNFDVGIGDLTDLADSFIAYAE